MKRQDDYELRREHLKDLSDDRLSHLADVIDPVA